MESKVTIDTKGICLLCLKSNSSKSTKGLIKTSTSLQMFIRYLKIDLSQVVECFNSFKPQFPQESGNKGTSCENVEGMLCDKCDDILNEFWMFYQDFEAVRLGLNRCVSFVHKRLEESKGINYASLVENFAEAESFAETKCHLEAVDNFRNETFMKCKMKLTSWPRVKLKKCRKPNDDKPAGNDDNLEKDPVDSKNLNKGTNKTSENCQDDKISSSGNAIDYLKNLAKGANPDTDEIMEVPVTEATTLNKAPYSSASTILPQAPPPTNSTMSVRNQEPKIKRSYNMFNLSFNPCHVENCVITRSSSFGDIFGCRFCGQMSPNRDAILMHLLESHVLQIYSDMLPSGTTSFKLEYALRDAVGKHLNHSKNWKKTSSLSCITCERVLTSESHLRSHIIFLHFNEVVTMICSHFGIISPLLPNSGGNTNNIQATIPNLIPLSGGTTTSTYPPPITAPPPPLGTSLFQCRYCQSVFSSQNLLNRHFSLEHTLLAFQTALPAHTTELLLKTAIQCVMSKFRPRREDGQCPFESQYCPSNLFKEDDYKLHILHCHLSHVVHQLQLSFPQPGSSVRIQQGNNNSSPSPAPGASVAGANSHWW